MKCFQQKKRPFEVANLLINLISGECCMDNKKHKWFNWVGFGMNVALLHLIGIVCLLSSASGPTLWGLGFLAYTLGLRHAFDADHIVAIDNTIRKLVQQKKNTVGVGFYFSLGHSTVVFLMTVATLFVAQWAETSIPELKDIGRSIDG